MNGKRVMHAWRKSIRLNLVKLIRKNCNELMKLLRYKMVKYEAELRNIDINLTESLFTQSSQHPTFV